MNGFYLKQKQIRQDLQDFFFHFPFPEEKENIQSPPANK